jgi:hypothetical protein
MTNPASALVQTVYRRPTAPPPLLSTARAPPSDKKLLQFPPLPYTISPTGDSAIWLRRLEMATQKLEPLETGR